MNQNQEHVMIRFGMIFEGKRTFVCLEKIRSNKVRTCSTMITELYLYYILAENTHGNLVSGLRCTD